jgi:hypothetical protein
MPSSMLSNHLPTFLCFNDCLSYPNYSIPKTANPAAITPPATGTAIGAAAPVPAVVVAPAAAVLTWLATDETLLDTADWMDVATEPMLEVKELNSLFVAMLESKDEPSLASEPTREVPWERMELSADVLISMSGVVVVWAVAAVARRA